MKDTIYPFSSTKTTRNRLVEPEGFSPRNRTKMQVISYLFFTFCIFGTNISWTISTIFSQPEQREPDSTVFLNVGGKRFEVKNKSKHLISKRKVGIRFAVIINPKKHKLASSPFPGSVA